MIKGLIFDMDGTIIDSMTMWKRMGYDYVISKGINPHTDILLDMHDLNMVESLEYLKNNYFSSQNTDDIYKELMDMIRKNYQMVDFKPGAKEFIIDCYNKGIKMFIATATKRDLAIEVLDRLDISKYFLGVITVGEIKVGKKHPDIYHYSLDKLGLKQEEVLVFEDNHHAIKTAHDAGYKVYAVYEETQKMYLDKIKESAEKVINDYQDFKLI